MNTSVLKEILKIYEAQSLEQLALLVRPAPDDMLTMAELAVRLKMTVRTLATWINDGKVVPIRVDKTILFYWPSVVARLLAHYQQTPEEDGTGGKRKPATGTVPAVVRPPAPLPTGALRPAVATGPKRPQ